MLFISNMFVAHGLRSDDFFSDKYLRLKPYWFASDAFLSDNFFRKFMPDFKPSMSLFIGEGQNEVLAEKHFWNRKISVNINWWNKLSTPFYCTFCCFGLMYLHHDLIFPRQRKLKNEERFSARTRYFYYEGAHDRQIGFKKFRTVKMNFSCFRKSKQRLTVRAKK